MSESIDDFMKGMNKFMSEHAKEGFRKAITLKIASASFSLVLYNLYTTTFNKDKDIINSIIENTVLNVEDAIKEHITSEALEALTGEGNEEVFELITSEEKNELFEKSKEPFLEAVSEEKKRYIQILKTEFDKFLLTMEKAKEILNKK